MDFTQAVAALTAAGYKYYGRRMISGLDFDTPSGDRVYYTEKQVIELAESL